MRAPPVPIFPPPPPTPNTHTWDRLLTSESKGVTEPCPGEPSRGRDGGTAAGGERGREGGACASSDAPEVAKWTFIVFHPLPSRYYLPSHVHPIAYISGCTGASGDGVVCGYGGSAGTGGGRAGQPRNTRTPCRSLAAAVRGAAPRGRHLGVWDRDTGKAAGERQQPSSPLFPSPRPHPSRPAGPKPSVRRDR